MLKSYFNHIMVHSTNEPQPSTPFPRGSSVCLGLSVRLFFHSSESHKQRSQTTARKALSSTTMAANNNADTSNKRGGSIIISVAGDEYETELVEDKNPFVYQELQTKKKVSKLQALAISRKKNRKVSALSAFNPPSSTDAPLVATSKHPAPKRHNPFDEEVPFDEGDKAGRRNPFDDDKRDSSGHNNKNAGGINPFDDDLPLAKECIDIAKNPFDDDSI